LRTDTSGDPSFTQLLARVKDTALGAYAHQDLPFEYLVEVLNPTRSLAHHPLFQIALAVQNTPEADFTLPGLDTSLVPASTGTAKFDLSIHLWEHHKTHANPQGLDGFVEYASDLFDPATVEMLVTRFIRVLDAITSDPDQPIGQIDLLTSNERHQLLVEWNDTTQPIPPACLPQLFENQVVRTPDNTAVTSGDNSLTYNQLNTAANHLAHRLISLGVGPEQIVALALPRSTSMIVAFLGVLKTGAAYLPLDPDYPPARIEFMLTDAHPALLVTTTSTVAAIPSDGAVHQLVIDAPDTRAALAQYPDTDPTDADRIIALNPQHPAYVIYTSGSTGTPKGAVISHRSLTAYLVWAQQSYPSLHDVAVLHSPVSFDLTVTTLFGPFVVGGCIHLVDLPVNLEVRDSSAGMTCAFLKATPSHLALLKILPDAFSPTGDLVVGGEQLLGEVLDEWRRTHPTATVINSYGPTETTVACTEYRIKPRKQLASGPVPIGRPMANTRVYVLDAGLQPVAVGVVGELYIAGVGLA
ncbi:MAG: non-ribosomal peptide synthetase, partial [Pseudonocardiaceae bacterium]